jgi:hypothetical protein
MQKIAFREASQLKLFTAYYWDDQINDTEADRTYSTHGGDKK